jgi:head-tail adaptor
MAICKKIRRVDKRICIGAMNRKIILQVRTLTPPDQDGVDFNEVFTEPKTVWANIVTVNGIILFDNTNTAREISHDLYIRYIANLSAQSWVTLVSKDSTSDQYLDIIQVENLNEENKFLRLRCSLRGSTAKPVNYR